MSLLKKTLNAWDNTIEVSTIAQLVINEAQNVKSMLEIRSHPFFCIKERLDIDGPQMESMMMLCLPLKSGVKW